MDIKENRSSIRESSYKNNPDKPKIHNKENQDTNINRAMMRATWVSALCSIPALLLSAIAIYFTFQQNLETINITRVHKIENLPAEVIKTTNIFSTESTTETTGIISVHWKIFLSNTGSREISIIKYDLLEVRDDSQIRLLQYSGLDQGLYTYEDNTLVPLKTPFFIRPGETISIFVKAGLIMHPKAYNLITAKYDKNSEKLLLQNLVYFLHSNNTDFYGNQFTETHPGIFRSSSNLQEQIFSLNFETSRGTSATKILSWYTYSGLMD